MGHVALAVIEMGPTPLAPGIYRGALLAAAGVVIALSVLLAVRRGLPLGASAACLGVMVAAAVVGARLLHWATHPGVYSDDPSRLWAGGFGDFALYGGLIGACAAGPIACRLARVRAWALADCVAPAAGFALAVARLGCFLNGCCFGRACDLPWAVRYPAGSGAHLHQLSDDLGMLFTGPQAVHPTQLYELLAALAAAALAAWLVRRRVGEGVACLSAVIAFTAFRWLDEPLRAPSPGLVAGVYPLLYQGVLIAATAALLWRLRAARRSRARTASEKCHTTTCQGPAPVDIRDGDERKHVPMIRHRDSLGLLLLLGLLLR